MNRKSYSVLFSCLLVTTFFHELNAKGLAPSNPSLKALDRQKRGTSAKPLTLSCPSKNLLVIQNKTASAALVIDISIYVFALLNGTSGSGICLGQNGTKGYDIPDGLWSSANETLEDFLTSIGYDLSALLNVCGSSPFDLGTVTKKTLDKVTNIVLALVGILDSELLADAALALELIISVVDVLLELIVGPLEGLLDLVEGFIVLTVDILGLVNILQGLETVLGLVAGSLQGVVDLGVDLVLEPIIGAVDGLMALVSLILQLGDVLDLTPLAGLLGDPESLCLLIAQLGGNVGDGLSGLFLVTGNLLALVSNSTEIEVFINVLIQFVSEAGQIITSNPQEDLNEELSLLLDACAEVNATDVLGDLVTTIEALSNGNLTIGKTDISGVIETLLNGILEPVDDLLSLVVEVIILVLDVTLALPDLLLILIAKLDSPLGIQQLLDLGIDLSGGGCICKLLSSVLKEVGDLVGLLLFGNLFAVLVDLPVIGDVVKELNEAVKAASGGKFDLETFLNLTKLVEDLIKGLLQLVSGIHIGVPQPVVKQAEIVLENCTSPYVFAHIIKIVSVSN